MRGPWIAVWMIGCASSEHAAIDASPPDAGCQPEVLLAGGIDPITQGWQIATAGLAHNTQGADYVRLETDTTMNASTGGQLLLYRPGAVSVPFALEVVLLVERAASHNQDDAPVAIMASFVPQYGTPAERDQMVYLEATRVGWADGQQQADFAVIDGGYHTYKFVADTASTARLSVDGTAILTRTGFATNGTIAIGDQTNEPGLDSALRIRSVQKLCP